MASHSSILAWQIPWTEEPGRLKSMGLQRVGHDWVTEPGSQYFFSYLFSFFLFKNFYWSIVAFRFHWWFNGEESACHAGDLFSIPGLGRSPEKGNGNSSILAWRIPWTEELGRLQSMGLQRVRHDWMTKSKQQLLYSVVLVFVCLFVFTVLQSEIHTHTHRYICVYIYPLFFQFPSHLGHLQMGNKCMKRCSAITNY